MRIIGYIPHPAIKITVFKMDDKLSVKLETALYEQTYKFRMDNDIDGLAAIQKLVDTPFLQKVLDNFNQMNTWKQEAIARNFPMEEEDEFEEII